MLSNLLWQVHAHTQCTPTVSWHYTASMRSVHHRLTATVCMAQFELSRSVLAGFDALTPLTLEALLEGFQASQVCTWPAKAPCVEDWDSSPPLRCYTLTLRSSLSGLWSPHVRQYAGLGAQVVYLDLRKVKIQQDACNLINVGPCACLAGQIAIVQGQQGAPSQARHSTWPSDSASASQ